MELRLEHRKLITAADLGHLWQDEHGNIYWSGRGKNNAGWSRSNVTKPARELIAAEYLRRGAGEAVEATDTGRKALRDVLAKGFAIICTQVA